MRTRLNSIHAVADELFALLHGGEWPLAFKQIDLSDKEIRRGFVPKDFWQDSTRPSVEIDGDGVEYVELPHYTNHSLYDAHLLFHGLRTEYYGLARNIKAWEDRHPLPAAPPPAEALIPAPPLTATSQVMEPEAIAVTMTEPTVAVPSPAGTSSKKRWRGELFQSFLVRRYPPEGKLPDVVTTPQAYGDVTNAMEDYNKANKANQVEIPSYRTFASYVGRNPRRR
jgi:hypothetical protein